MLPWGAGGGENVHGGELSHGPEFEVICRQPPNPLIDDHSLPVVDSAALEPPIGCSRLRDVDRLHANLSLLESTRLDVDLVTAHVVNDVLIAIHGIGRVQAVAFIDHDIDQVSNGVDGGRAAGQWLAGPPNGRSNAHYAA
ncbi:hypothetical protein AB0L53_42185 [Nonomuraea sp. NPDC052129]|uniref:hypothetical protein n=1 Tax=Nonomuraea sp. NPDC052129 TaxID=3154651 RepID=UPI00342B1734